MACSRVIFTFMLYFLWGFALIYVANNVTGFSVGYYKKSNEIFPYRHCFSTLASLRMFICTVSNEDNTYLHSCNTITILQYKLLMQLLDSVPPPPTHTHTYYCLF